MHTRNVQWNSTSGLPLVHYFVQLLHGTDNCTKSPLHRVQGSQSMQGIICCAGNPKGGFSPSGIRQYICFSRYISQSSSWAYLERTMSYEVDLVNIMYCAGKVDKNSATLFETDCCRVGKCTRKAYVMLVLVSNVSYHSGKDHCHRQYTQTLHFCLLLKIPTAYSGYPFNCQMFSVDERILLSLSFFFSELSENKEAYGLLLVTHLGELLIASQEK